MAVTVAEGVLPPPLLLLNEISMPESLTTIRSSVEVTPDTTMGTEVGVEELRLLLLLPPPSAILRLASPTTDLEDSEGTEVMAGMAVMVEVIMATMMGLTEAWLLPRLLLARLFATCFFGVWPIVRFFALL